MVPYGHRSSLTVQGAVGIKGASIQTINPYSAIFMKHVVKYILLACSILIALGANVWADDVLNTINEAVNQYKNGDFSGAASNLDYASQLIRQKKSEQMKKLLPEPLPGWNAEPANAQALGTAVFGGGINASRTYTRKTSTISIDIVSDSPLMQSLLMMLNNPMLAGASGGKLESIRGQRAIIQYNEEKMSGEVNIIVGNHILVTVKGQKVDRADIVAYTQAIDLDALAKN